MHEDIEAPNENSEYEYHNYKRGEDQTYLTYPEWFLVFSPKEYAKFLKSNPSADFHYLNHIKQFWGAYFSIYKDIKNKYKFNTEYHIMINVIGVSTTFEYLIKFIYGNTIYLMVDTFSKIFTSNRTEEEVFGATVTQDYVDFIENTPWYEFDFIKSLKEVWNISFKKKNILKQVERKIAMSIEYSFKALYAYVIKKASEGSFDKPSLETVCKISKCKIKSANVKLISDIKTNKNSILVALPRYQGFTTEAVNLALSGANFKEIAGNSDIIVLSIIVNKDTVDKYREKYSVLFKYDISTDESKIRYVLKIQISELSKFIRDNKNDTIEHIYDF